MQLPMCIGREASCLTVWQDIADEEAVSRITSVTKFFSYLLTLDSFHVLHLAAIPCLTHGQVAHALSLTESKPKFTYPPSKGLSPGMT